MSDQNSDGPRHWAFQRARSRELNGEDRENDGTRRAEQLADGTTTDQPQGSHPSPTVDGNPEVFFINYSFTLPRVTEVLSRVNGAPAPGQERAEGDNTNNNTEGVRMQWQTFVPNGAFVYPVPVVPVGIRFPSEESKPRASRRAIEKLERVSLKDLAEGETNCPICFEPFEEPPNDEENWTEESATENRHENHRDDRPSSEILDPPVSTPTAMDEDPPVGDPNVMDEDPPESVPDVKQNNSSESSEDSHCPVNMPCHHVFGFSCIKEWLGSNNTCPLCRTAVESHGDYLRATGQQPEYTPFNGPAGGLFDLIFSYIPNMMRTQVETSERERQQQSEQQPSDTDLSSGSRPTTTSPSSSSSGSDSFHSAQSAADIQRSRSMSSTLRSFRTRSDTWVGSDADSRTPSQGNAIPVTAVPVYPGIRPGSGGGGVFVSIRRETRDPQRHHPYRARSDTNVNSNSNSGSTSSTTLFGDSLSDVTGRRDLRCASLPLALCVGPGTSNYEAAADGQDGNRLVRLECGHGYHVPCLQMCMRAHGDSDIPNLTGDMEHGVHRNVWCTRCRRYRDINC